MALAYADTDRTMTLTGMTTEAEEAALVGLNNALSLEFTNRVKRIFGLLPADLSETRNVPSRGGAVVRLDVPLRLVTALVINAVSVDPSAYTLVLDTPDGEWWGIERIDGELWPVGTLTVTASWADLVAGVPEDVRQAVTLLVSGEIVEAKSPPSTGLLGADGIETPQRTRWDHPTVKQAIEAHRIKRWVPR